MPRHVDAPAGGCTKDEPTLLALRIRRIPDPKALEKVKSTLRYRDPDPAIAEVTFLDDGIGSFFFGDAQPLKNEEGPVPVSNRKLWMATSWLQDRAPEQFEKLRAEGMDCDVAMSRYSGPIPWPLLKELSRLKLELWLIPGVK